MTNQLLSIKAKKIGVRLASFRQKKGVSTDVLSMWIGIPKEELEKIESGESTISLPLIELIALKLGLMTESLLTGQLDNDTDISKEKLFNQQYATLRDRIIALTLRKTRTEQEKTIASVAIKCGVSETELEQYESGSTAIPWPVLERLCEEYKLSIFSLASTIKSNDVNPDQKPNQVVDSQHFSKELSEFIENPANLPYLELAKRLSGLDAAKLRSIAEGLLEITY